VPEGSKQISEYLDKDGGLGLLCALVRLDLLLLLNDGSGAFSGQFSEVKVVGRNRPIAVGCVRVDTNLR
jgi:hypothetical protein